MEGSGVIKIELSMEQVNAILGHLGRLPTDWRFRSDMTPSQDWKDYCQALRDVPAQVGFPHNITWPTQPE